MLKDLSALAPTSFGALIMVIYTVVMMVMRYRDGSYTAGGQYAAFAKPVDTSGDPHMYNGNLGTLNLVNSLAIAFLCHYNGCKYYREFKKHTPDRFVSRIAISFGVIDIIFGTAMCVGYATFGSITSGVVLNNYSPTDSLANFARIGMGVANMFSFPLMFSGLREAILPLIVFFCPSMSATADLVWFQNAVSASLVVVITVLAVLITDAGLIVGLVGSICGATIIYVVPCLLYDRILIRFAVQSNACQVMIVRLIGSIGVVLVFAGAWVTLEG
jgi:sodium-coupled neutral amino acid transporter 1